MTEGFGGPHPAEPFGIGSRHLNQRLRRAVIADLAPRQGPLRLVGVHLGLLRRSRRAQQDHLRAALAGRDPRPTLIIGDYNEWSVTRGLGRFARDFEIVTPGRTFPSRRPFLSLDRIAHSPDLTVKVLPLPVLPCGGRSSDHLPVLCGVSAS